MSGAEETPVPIEDLLQEVIDIVTSAKPGRISGTVRVDSDEVLGILDEAVAAIPEEMRRARWMLRDREEYLERVHRDGDHILQAAREQAERMVNRSEVLLEARHRAQKTIEDANEHARRLRHEVDDYCEGRLAALAKVLDRVSEEVEAGRRKLGVPPPEGDEALVGEGGQANSDGDSERLGTHGVKAAFFDQDTT